jgi:hypothetical protein
VINNRFIWKRFPIPTTTHETSVNINTADKAEHKIYKGKYSREHAALKFPNIGNKTPSDGVPHRSENGYLILTAEET